MKKIAVFLVMVVITILFTGCGGSLEQQKEKAIVRAEQAFTNKLDKNETLQAIAFHRPSGLTVKEDKPNNIILEKGSHPYILFYNPIVPSSSEELYELEKNQEGQMIVDKTFSVEDRFGYLLIMDAGDNKYEVTAGVGGVKATTESTVKQLESDAGYLMEMVASAQLSE
ncbi:hypothetical protein [Bacillus sp. FJAT-50079]|uniref:hypothetical protein n=1 Tax=Bacillus sp. FJAT-50079 TaxID=2833577 RepID=UPI001BC94619|nr:hypothetical protein [Bacillus sp. FJAT-50079]MBS4208638.1 hypothetical protein [Bacillus sp. FJAT-50079]